MGATEAMGIGDMERDAEKDITDNLTGMVVAVMIKHRKYRYIFMVDHMAVAATDIPRDTIITTTDIMEAMEADMVEDTVADIDQQQD